MGKDPHVSNIFPTFPSPLPCVSNTPSVMSVTLLVMSVTPLPPLFLMSVTPLSPLFCMSVTPLPPLFRMSVTPLSPLFPMSLTHLPPLFHMSVTALLLCINHPCRMPRPSPSKRGQRIMGKLPKARTNRREFGKGLAGRWLNRRLTRKRLPSTVKKQLESLNDHRYDIAKGTSS